MRYLIIGLLLCLAKPAVAQIHHSNQRFFELGGGLLDGVKTGKTDNAGKWLKVGFGKYGKKEGVWQAGILMQEKYFEVKEVGLIAVNQYSLEANFTPKFIRSADKSFYLSPSLGALLGYEQTNDRKLFPESDKKLSKWLMGFTGGVSAEFNISNTIALLGFSRSTVLPSSNIQPFHFQYGLGLKVNFFKQ